MESDTGERVSGTIRLAVRYVLSEKWTFYLYIMTNDQHMNVFSHKTTTTTKIAPAICIAVNVQQLLSRSKSPQFI